MSQRRAPRPLAAAFHALTDELAPQTLLADVQREWAATVGDTIARSASPTISCAASVWAQELDLMAPQIIVKLNARLGGVPVSRLRCVAVGHGR
jgi:predicted nucleic acid-binding Zn ribbon protein